jgi:hypothetical protein
MIKIVHDVSKPLPVSTDLGCYPLVYDCEDGDVLCATCANSDDVKTQDTPQWNVIGQSVNWEDPALFCAHCNTRIESAYA